MIPAEQIRPETSPADKPGLVESAQGLFRGLVRLLRTRAELLSIELAEEKERRKEMLILAVLGALFFALGIQLLAFLIVVIFWDTYRIAAITGVTVVYLGVAAWAFLRLKYKWSNSPSAFSATLEELGKDMDALQGNDE